MHLFDKRTHERIELPADRRDFRGHTVTVTRIAQDSRPGSAGKVETDDYRLFYPSVVGAYIADEPIGGEPPKPSPPPLARPSEPRAEL